MIKTRESNLLTNQLWLRLKKDHRLPITVFQEPILSHQIKLYSRFHEINSYQKMLLEKVHELGGADEYFKWEAKLRQKVIEDIGNKEAYKKFNQLDMNPYKVFLKGINKDNPYVSDNDGKWFASVDLVKANFQGMRYFDKNIFDNAVTWEEFLHKFTTWEYLLHSKQFRQVIFGNLNPKRHQTMAKYLMCHVIEILMNYGFKNLVWLSADEVFLKLDVNNIIESQERLIQLKDECAGLNNILVKPQIFRLKQLKPFGYYVKEYLDESFELKCVPGDFYAQALRAYLREFPELYDRAFIHQKNLAFFAKPLEFDGLSL